MDTSVSRVNYIPASIPFLSVRPSVRPSPSSSSRRQAKHCAAERRDEVSSSSSSSRSAKRRRLRVIGNRKAQPTRIQIIRPFISTATGGLAEPVVTRFRLIASMRIPLELLARHSNSSILPTCLCVYVCRN